MCDKLETICGKGTCRVAGKLACRGELAVRIELAMERCRRERFWGFAVLHVRFESFGLINSSMGHAAGKHFACEVGRWLLELSAPIIENMTPRPMVAALGEGIFGIFFEGAVDAFAAVEAAGRIESLMERPFEVEGKRISSPVSVGIVVSGMMHANSEEVLRDAGMAASQARTGGRGGCVVFDLPMHQRAKRRLELEAELREAIEAGQFELAYQPIVELAGERLVGFEALVRWQHPKRGLLLPGEFMEVAEETGLIVPLGNFVLRRAMAQQAHWRKQYPQRDSWLMTINVSRVQLGRPDFAETVGAALATSGATADALCLEVTESALMQDRQSAAWALRELKDMGMQLAMDDFGSGYSSLACLHEFPLNLIKVDRAFTRQLGNGKLGTAVIRVILMIASQLNVRVTAEGIETIQEATALRQLQCDWGQGFHFGRPMSAEAAARAFEGSTIKAVAAGEFQGIRGARGA